jgi:hypothetical protein
VSHIDLKRVPWDEFVALHLREIVATLAIALAAVVLLWGCAPSRERAITGAVSSNGKPVVFGTITVMTADNRAFSASINPDGTYEIRGLPPGRVRVAVSSPNPVPTPPRSEMPPDSEGPDSLPKAGRSATNGDRSAIGSGVGSAKGEKSAAGPDDGGRLSFMTKGVGDETRLQPAPAAAGWFQIPGRYANPNTSGLKSDVAVRGRTKLDLKVD